MLSDSDVDNDVHTLTVNEHYAKAFQYKKEREELAKLKEKYGSDFSSSGSSASEDSEEDSEETDEDSDGNELTPAVDAAILRTLARIKKKDPGIYEDGRQVFEEEQRQTQDSAPTTKRKLKDKSKPLTIRQAALTSALADSDSRSPSPEPKVQSLTHVEEQRLLRSETREAFHGAVPSTKEGETDGNSGSEDDFLIPRSRTRDEIEVEEEAYRTFLEREVGNDLSELVTVEKDSARGIGSSGEEEDNARDEGGKDVESKKRNKDEKSDPKTKKRKRSKEENDQEFLMNYILNRGWIDRSNQRLPTYNEIVGPSSNSKSRRDSKHSRYNDEDEDRSGDHDGSDREHTGGDTGEAGATFSDEDSFDDLVDAFETSYNFRFEEPNAAVIATHPRNLPSVRRESTTRKEARTRKKERQEAEKRALLETRKGEVRREREEVEQVLAEAGALKHDDVLGTHVESSIKTKKQQKKEEIARLKTLQGKDLRRRLERIGVEGDLTAVSEKALAHLDLDAPWDPSEHDAQMAALYADGSGDDGDDEEKPTWDDDINIDDIVPVSQSKAEAKKRKKKEKKKLKEGQISEDDGGVDVDAMDADVVEDDVDWDWDGEGDHGEEWNGTEEERKRKVDAYMDEVVNRLGFNDIKSHIPTRFHYTMTAPDSYGLTPTEILLATDAELNEYVGLKKLAPYRTQRGGKSGKKSWDPTRPQGLKDFRDKLHDRVGLIHDGAWSLGHSSNQKNSKVDGGEKKKRMGKKERAKLRAAAEDREGGGGDDHTSDKNQSQSLGQQPEVDLDQRHKKRSRDPGSDHPSANINPREMDTEEAHGDMDDSEPKKKRRRRHKKRSEASAATGQEEAVAL